MGGIPAFDMDDCLEYVAFFHFCLSHSSILSSSSPSASCSCFIIAFIPLRYCFIPDTFLLFYIHIYI